MLYLIYVSDGCVYMSGREENFDLDDTRILQLENEEAVDEYVRRHYEQKWRGFKSFRYEGYRLYLGDPDRFDLYYQRNPNAVELVQLNLNATAGDVLQSSRQNFGAGKKPLVVLQLLYAPL